MSGIPGFCEPMALATVKNQYLSYEPRRDAELNRHSRLDSQLVPNKLTPTTERHSREGGNPENAIITRRDRIAL
ncbi:MAG: hypothetical protein R3B84_16800 [Zavarzinella sp.]